MKSTATPKPASIGPIVFSRAPMLGAEAWKVDAVGFLGVALLAGLAYLLGAAPLLARHALVRNQQSELIAAREKSIALQKALAAAKLQWADAQRQVDASPLRLQPVAQLNQRLALVTELATHGGAGLDDLQPGKSEPGNQYDALSIHVAGTGSFPAFTSVLHRLREEFPDTAVSKLEISGNPQDPNDSAKFNLDLLWYTQPLKSAAQNRGKLATPAQNDASK